MIARDSPEYSDVKKHHNSIISDHFNIYATRKAILERHSQMRYQTHLCEIQAVYTTRNSILASFSLMRINASHPVSVAFKSIQI